MLDMDRRTFLGTMAAAMLASRAGAAASIQNIGMQLYTVRTDLEKDFAGTLAKVAAIGYKEVEFAGYFESHAEAGKGDAHRQRPDLSVGPHRLRHARPRQTYCGDRRGAHDRAHVPRQSVDR